ncbi:MAG TPA: ABC transporter permease [Pyrinomonadaceae bacterium]|nr:ABC transporter permease [Pyrinomonadaceae bacterium]
MLNTIWNDIRYALRMLRNRPGFTVVAVITLSLGIGANTAIFSVVNAVVLNPLPFPHPEEIVLVRDDLTGRQLENVGLSVDELKDFQERSGVFDQISAVWAVDANLTGSDRPERIELLAVSPNYFSLLGANAQLGRVFGPQDQAQGFAEGVVISDGLWHRLFGADPNVLGRKVYADTDLYTVIGVMPKGFRHPGKTLRNEVDMWGTAGFAANPFPNPPVRGQRMLPGAIGRLKSGLTVQQAQAKIDSFVSELKTQFPKEYPAELNWTVRLLPAREALVGNVQKTLMVLLGAVGLVLLIGCVNIANLLLARASSRRREMAIRLALGAGRRRLVAQLLTESLLLSFIGGVVALIVVASTMKLLLGLLPPEIPRLNEVSINPTVLGFVFLVSTITGLLFGLVPALQTSRPEIVGNLKEGTLGSGTGVSHQHFRSGLIIVEFALSLVLMIAAGLLLRSFGRLLEVKPGFDATNVLLARIWLPVPNNPEKDPYRDPVKRSGFIKEVLQRSSALPGVRHAAMSGGNGVPLLGPHNTNAFTIEGQAAADNSVPSAQGNAVSPEFFNALSIPLIRGRVFSSGDDLNTTPVVVVDEALVSRYFGTQDPVGHRIRPGGRNSNAPFASIVGVVGNIKSDGFDQPDQPHIYFPIFQRPGYAMAVYLQTDPDPITLTRSLREQVQAVDPNLPVFGERSMQTVVSDSLGQRRFAMQVVALFGVLALLLASIGIYGVMAYAVNQRTREIGIRVALGASRAMIMRWVLRQGLVLIAIGVGTGLLAAFALMRLLQSLLFGVATTDLVTYTTLALLLAVVALAACYIPALRATKIDPLVALRHE